MGVVYRARQVSLNRTVALKMIRETELPSPDEVRRLRFEAAHLAQLDHPNIVPIYEIGEHAGLAYIAMKWIPGNDLRGAITHFTHNPRAAAQLLAKAARAVHHAHQRGVLHRDLKPANILLDANKQPHVTDFGLAKQMAGAPTITQSGAIVGTASYIMAVVEARAGSPDSETFWWDGASVFWQLVFLGLLEDTGPAVCRGCGALLGDLTPTGRRKKASVCKSCTYRNWWDSQPSERKRDRWNTDYRKRKKRQQERT
jgi:hypothetical protein